MLQYIELYHKNNILVTQKQKFQDESHWKVIS